MEVIAAVKKRRAAEILAADIRNRIVRGELTPQSGLPPEGQLIQEFGVSRPTMREAMSILESAGLIEVVRGARGGARVKPFTGHQTAELVGQTLQASGTALRDVLEARWAVEPSAARLAAERRPTEAALALRERIIAEYEALDDAPRFERAVAAFNRTLLEVSGNQTLALVGHTLHSIIQKHVSIAQAQVTRLQQPSTWMERVRAYLKAQEKLANLIAAGDGAAAEDYWRGQLRADVNYFWLGEASGSGQLNVLD